MLKIFQCFICIRVQLLLGHSLLNLIFRKQMKLAILLIVAYSVFNVSESGRPCLDHKGNLQPLSRTRAEIYLGPDGCRNCICTRQGNQCFKGKCNKGDACMDRFGKVHQIFGTPSDPPSTTKKKSENFTYGVLNIKIG